MTLDERLAREGYAVLPTHDVPAFVAACATLGAVDPLTDVRIVPGETQYPFRPAAVPFHTDHPRYDVVAWHCLESDEIDGANLLVDARIILDRLPQGIRSRLATAQVRLIRSREHLAIFTPDPYRVYWVPPLIRERSPMLDPETTEAVRSFQHELDAVVSTGNVPSVRLAPGESLFVNNRWMLHGRSSISSRSRRHLVRACIIRP